VTVLGKAVVIVVEHDDPDGNHHYAGEIAHIATDVDIHPPGKTALMFGRKGSPAWTKNEYFRAMNERRVRGTV